MERIKPRLNPASQSCLKLGHPKAEGKKLFQNIQKQLPGSTVLCFTGP